MTNLATGLQDILRNGNFRGIMRSVGIKLSAAVSSFILFLLAARVLNDDVFGRFTILFSLASMLAVFAAFGQEMLIIRLWNQYGAKKDYELLKGAVIFGIAICAIGGLISSLGFGLYLATAETEGLAWSAAFFVLALTFVLFFSHLCRSIVNVTVGDGHRDVTALVPVNLFLLICMIFGVAVSLEWLFIMLVLGCLIALVLKIKAMREQIKLKLFGAFKGIARYDIKNWTPPSLRLWVVTVLESSNQFLEVVLIGFLLNPTAAGVYFVATRLANAFSTAADAFNMFGSKHIPDHYYRREHKELATLLKTMAIMTLLVIAGGVTVFAVGGEFILALFSKSYAEFYGVLMILCLGTAGLAASGPATQMLMLTGHEGRYLKIMALSVFLRIVGFYLLIPLFDIYGAAIANAISLIVIAVFVSVSAKLLTGHDPSIMRLISSAPVPATKSNEV